MTMRFEDPAADFIPAVEKVFGTEPRVLDGSRAVLVGDVERQLEAGVREPWLIERTGGPEQRLAEVRAVPAARAAAREAAAKDCECRRRTRP